MHNIIKKALLSLIVALCLVPQIAITGDAAKVYAQEDSTQIEYSEAEAEYTAKDYLSSEINVMVTDLITKYPLEGVELELLVDNVSKGRLITGQDGYVHFVFKQEFSSKKTKAASYISNSDDIDPFILKDFTDNGMPVSYDDAYSYAYMEAKAAAEESVANKINSTQHNYRVVIKKAREGYEAPSVLSYAAKTESGSKSLDFSMTSRAKTGSIHIEKNGNSLAGYKDKDGEHKVILYEAPIVQPYALNLSNEYETWANYLGQDNEALIKGEDSVIKEFIYEDMPLMDVGFCIFAGEDIFSPDGSGTLLYECGELVKYGYTDEYGKLSYYNLPLGKYLVREVENRPGYIIDSREYRLEITSDEQVQYCRLSNKLYSCDIGLINQDIETGEKLSGAVFGLYANTNILAGNGELLIPKGQLISIITIGDNGASIIGNGLPNGSFSDNQDQPMYYIREIKAADGYYNNAEFFYIEMSTDEEDEEYEDRVIIVKDKKISLQKQELIDKDYLPALPVGYDATISTNTDYQLEGVSKEATASDEIQYLSNESVINHVDTGDNTLMASYIWTILMSISFLTILVIMRLDSR